jgi:hypothetical protein
VLNTADRIIAILKSDLLQAIHLNLLADFCLPKKLFALPMPEPAREELTIVLAKSESAEFDSIVPSLLHPNLIHISTDPDVQTVSRQF